VAGADEKNVAGTDAHALGTLGGVESVRRDHLARAKTLDAASTCEVEQHAAADDPGADLVDAVARRAPRSERGRRKAVVEAAVVPDVREAVPLRRALERHRDEVVGIAWPLGISAEPAVDRAHQVDRVHASALADLRALGAEG